MAQKQTSNAPKASTISSKVKGLNRGTDTSLEWVGREYPQLTAWRILAVEWLKGEVRGVGTKLEALVTFLERYLIKQGLPLEPATLLSRETAFPEFYQTACPDTKHGIEYNNAVHAFLHFVLLHEFSELAADGQLVVLPTFRNPVRRMSKSGHAKRNESVYSPLPYGYIDELRAMLAAGPHFRDWEWAQSALGLEINPQRRAARIWFEVTEEKIDRKDPDCVWRERQTSNGTCFEIWSPVRWVALLIKLILPLRTFQVRMLDSGEADTWCFSGGSWGLNPSRLAKGNERKPWQQGMFCRRAPVINDEAVSTVLYINTNKTADIAKSGADKGYTIPWPFGGLMHMDAYYWLEKLRNWQEKYNPLSRSTNWSELDGRHIKAKSSMQLASYSSVCFLFRLPESDKTERHLPIRHGTLEVCWFRLLGALEKRLAARGETHYNGLEIRFLPPLEDQNNGLTTLFPLHSLRVSLITALALDGQVPLPILQKLVGHSRLLMTLYYTKPGATHIRDALLGATERLEASKEVSIQNFLLDTDYHELMQAAICNSVLSLAAAIPEHPAMRSPAGWMLMHHGLCLVGGNTSEVEENPKVGGCYNGGPIIATGSISKLPKYAPVPGGSRNCIRCRWFVTEPHHLPALVAHFNTLAYHFDEARNACLTRENELQDLKKQKADAEDAGQPFKRFDAYRQAERVWESAMKLFSDLAEDLVACWRLIERCKSALEESQSDGIRLVSAGTAGDVNIALEETESELLQLATVCENTEIYPDLKPGKAVFRRSQLLDAVLYREDLPPVFMMLSEQEQLLAGNAFMRHLSQQMNPANPTLGRREVIQLMDAGVKLSQRFGINLTSILPMTNRVQAFSDGQPASNGR